MKLNFETYKDKVHACWIGKNIGGTMGTPYEGKREMQNISGFVTEKNVVLPNDDLDLQLVWLNAAERFGVTRVNAQLLGEFWISFVTPHWNEYGLGKANMKIGLMPPLSGDAFNSWKHSNGAWIRTEIWATLAPGAPDVAAKYAYEDACVDHGAEGEGTVAAVFVAAIESAAFFEKDIRRLINIGLSKIPESSRMYKSIKLLLKCYDDGMDYVSARNAIFEANADIGDGWFEAPSNVSYAMLGLLWGEGDFKKSMIYAINCGDDTDCTGATVGSILGLMYGTAGIPADWSEHIGDTISTISIPIGALYTVPKTCTELTKRVVRLAPCMLIENGTDVELSNAEDEIPGDIYERTLADCERTKTLFRRPAYSFTIDMIHSTATVILPGNPKIKPGESMKVKVVLENNVRVHKRGLSQSAPMFMKLRWLLPEGFSVTGDKCVHLDHWNAHNTGIAECEFEISCESCDSINRLVLEIVADGRLTSGYLPIVLLG